MHVESRITNHESRVSSLRELRRLGQSVWLDNLSRELLRSGALARLIEEDGLSGITSNPTIFHKAISGGRHYDDDLARLKETDLDAERRYEALVIPDVQAACDLLRPVYEETGGDDGYVSLELSPALAHDEEASVRDAVRLRRAIARENALIKVPATPEGVRAFERLTAAGFGINVTLMFSLGHVEQVAQAYLRGLREWVQQGGDPRAVKSVASVFLSRVDTLVDRQLDERGASVARGRAAVSLAKLAYQRYRAIFHGPAFEALAAAGARPQYLLWGSTGTKNPAYSDVLYVEPVIGPETVNTMPDATLAAFRDHGRPALTLEQGVDEARAHFDALLRAGIDPEAVGAMLQAEGVRLFEQSFSALLALMP